MTHTQTDYTTKYKIDAAYAAYTTSIKHVTKTATDDLAFRMIDTDLWLKAANIECANYNAKYGDSTAQNNTLLSPDVLTYEDFNLADLYFKNLTAGSNTTLYCTGVLMTEAYKWWIGLI